MSAEIPEASPLVSVLIRSMDRASLSEALAAVAAQTYEPIEVVLVNAKGGGHRDVGEWCGSFPIRLSSSASALTRSAAANEGLVQARGTYLMFLDDDDLIDAGHIASMVNTLREFPNSRAAFSGTRVTDAAGLTVGTYHHEYSREQLLVGNFLPIHAVLFSRELVQEGCRFDTTFETYEDWDFWLQISRRTDFVPTGVVSAIYRSFLGDSGMSRTEDRPLQRQRRSVVWRKWWPLWSVENLDLLASDLERAREEKEKENAELRRALNVEVAKNSQLHHDVAAVQRSMGDQVSSLGRTISDLDATLTELKATLADREIVLTLREEQISRLSATILEMELSTSWKLSAPIRQAGRAARVLRRKIKAAGLLAEVTWNYLRRDSVGNQMAHAYRYVQQQGWPGVKQRLIQNAPNPIGVNTHVFPAPVLTKELEPSAAVRLTRDDHKPLVSIDVDRYEYFFFDVFDTAVIRLLEKPVDVFKYIGFVTQSAAFESIRVHQERMAREVNKHRKDVKLAEIYQAFSGSDAECEMQAELKFCVAHPETLAFYSDLVSRGKKIYFVSDMYLDRETIAAILHKNGFDKYEDIFVSSEDDLIKGDGSRFAWLKTAVPESVGNAIHIGDNRVSDWAQPRQHGYDAFHYTESIEFYRHDAFLFSKAPHLIAQDSLGISFMLGMFRYWKSGTLDAKPGYWRQFGFLYGGALVSAFCGFINNSIAKAQLSTPRVFFLARDGDIMSKVHKLLYPEVDAVYLLASRRCMSFPSLSTMDLADDGDAMKLFSTPIGIAGVGDLMERFGYDDLHELREALSQLASRGLLNSESEILNCLVDNKTSVLAKANAERTTLLGYLSAIKFFDDPDIVIADVGWGGTIQNALVKLLQHSGRADRRLHGIYLGVADGVAHEAFKTGFLFQGDKSRFSEFLNLIELITSSPKDGVLRVAELDGNYAPVGVGKNADELNRQSIAAEIQTGILEFANIVKDKEIGNLDFFKPRDFEVLFRALQEHPSEEDVDHLGRVKHAMTLGNHFGDQVLNKKEPNAAAKLKIITVFINPSMYERFFLKNAVVNGCDLVPIDNRHLNRGLPAIYNELIARHLDENCWLFFVHEDYEVKDGLSVIDQLDQNHVYGTFGLNFENNSPVPYGLHVCSNKDGSRAVEVGHAISQPAAVQTLDCQSILVHSSLLRNNPTLRFDEKLTFDLYAEDFCINAKYQLGIISKVFPLTFQHYSHGSITERYHSGLRYLAEKYPDVAVAGSCSFIGGRSKDLEKYFVYGAGQVQSTPGSSISQN